jgi:hypothetical protein
MNGIKSTLKLNYSNRRVIEFFAILKGLLVKNFKLTLISAIRARQINEQFSYTLAL